MNISIPETEIISLLLDDDYIRVPVKLAKLIGLNEAIVLRKIHEWVKFNSKKKNSEYLYDGNYWTHQSYKEFEADFPWWSFKTIQRTIQALQRLGLIIFAQPKKPNGDCTKWYRVDTQKLIQIYLNSSTPSGQFDLTPLDNLTSPPLDNLTTPSGQFDLTPLDNLTSCIYKEEITKEEITKQITNYSPLTPQGEIEGGEIPHVEIEIVSEDAEQDFSSNDKVEIQTVVAEERLSVKAHIPARESENNFQSLFPIQEIFERTGKVPNYGVEYKTWIQAEMGDVITHYRKSGNALNRGANDIHTHFKSHVASRGNNGKGLSMSAAERWIVNCEKDPDRWPELRTMVGEWLLVEQTGDRNLNVARELERSSRPPVLVNLNF